MLHELLPSGKAGKQAPGRHCLRGLPSLLVAGQHPLGAINPLAEAVLKRIVLLAFLDMVCDSHSDDFRDWLAIDSCDHVQFLRLVGGQANCHCLDSLHSCIVHSGIVVVKNRGCMVSSSHDTRKCYSKEG